MIDIMHNGTWILSESDLCNLVDERDRLRVDLEAAQAELHLVKCGEPNHPDRAYAMKGWLRTFGFNVYVTLKHGDVGHVLALLQDGDISRSKAAEAIAELLVGNEPALPESDGDTFGEDEMPREVVAALRSRVAELEAATARIAALEADKSKELMTAFVDGAKWWEWKRVGATMWQSDQNDAADAWLEKQRQRAAAREVPIHINKSPTADTRTCDFKSVSKETLRKSSVIHISDVRLALDDFCEQLQSAGLRHDWDKLERLDEFHADFLTGFERHEWWDNHRKVNRHHLQQQDGVPADVNLIDVLDMIADCVMAGMARSGSVYEVKIDPSVLMAAFANTVKQLTERVVVNAGEDDA